MQHVSLRFTWTAFFLLCVPAFAYAASPFTLSTMPRVDVHAHIRPSWEVIDEYMELRDAIKKEYDVEMAMWFSLIGMVAASVHVANPCGIYGRRTTGWIPDPVVFWQHQRRWENVLIKHPKLVAVNAHMLWLCYSDEQLDYLRYMLTTYPNLNIDIATTPEMHHFLNRENLRDFMIEYSDRILFGTDMGTKWFAPDLGGAGDKYKTRAANYKRYFDYLETDKVVPGDFVDVTKGQKGVRLGEEGKRKIQGLALPQEVLEKIYFRNAMRIYPHVKANLKELGYPVE